MEAVYSELVILTAIDCTVPDKGDLTSLSIFMDSMIRTVSPSLTASPALTFKEKMEPGKGAGMVVPPPEGLGEAGAGAAGSDVVAAGAIVPVPPAATSTVKSFPLTLTR